MCGEVSGERTRRMRFRVPLRASPATAAIMAAGTSSILFSYSPFSTKPSLSAAEVQKPQEKSEIKQKRIVIAGGGTGGN
jgi:hypothetical protein